MWLKLEQVRSLQPESLIETRNCLAQRRNRQKVKPLTEDILSRMICQRCRKGKLSMDRIAPVEEIYCNSCGER